jgi:hypothetical protein
LCPPNVALAGARDYIARLTDRIILGIPDEEKKNGRFVLDDKKQRPQLEINRVGTKDTKIHCYPVDVLSPNTVSTLQDREITITYLALTDKGNGTIKALNFREA